MQTSLPLSYSESITKHKVKNLAMVIGSKGWSLGSYLPEVRNSNFFLTNVPSLKLLAFRDLLQKLSASLLCRVNTLRFSVIVWLALHRQHAQPTWPSYSVCVSVLSSLPLCIHYVCSCSHSRIWQEKEICLSWVQIIEFLE